MIKLVALVKRNPALTQEEFARRWRDEHAPLVRGRLPGLRKYVINPAIVQPGRGEPAWDGFVELYFDDLAARERAFSSGGWLSDDRSGSSDGLLELGSIVSFVTEEYIVPLD